MFSAEIGSFLHTVAAEPTAAPKGLDLAQATIDEVILNIETEQQNLSPHDFAADGAITDISFGGGDRAPELAQHYRLAHNVVTETLHGVKQDLKDFQEACRKASQAIVGVDDDARDRVRAKQIAVDALTTGTRSRHGQTAYQDAQQHQNDGRDA